MLQFESPKYFKTSGTLLCYKITQAPKNHIHFIYTMCFDSCINRDTRIPRRSSTFSFNGTLPILGLSFLHPWSFPSLLQNAKKNKNTFEVLDY